MVKLTEDQTKQKELLEKLIAHYSVHINRIKDIEQMFAIYDYMKKMCIQLGICYCSKVIFDSWIYNARWVNIDGQLSWFDLPITMNTKEGVMQALEFRVNKMKNILKDLTNE